jgi:hypothetical protein
MKYASFAELEASENVDPSDLIATLRNYAEGGAGISSWVVQSIIARTPLDQDQIAHLLESAEIGRQDQRRRGFQSDATAYASIAAYLATVVPAANPALPG